MSFKLLLDSANLEEIKQAIDYYPIEGLTTNPSLIAKEAVINPIKHLNLIKNIIGDERCLHIQVTQNTSNEIIKQARNIKKEFGKNIYVKIPTTKEGLKAMKELSGEMNVTATLIYTPAQAILAAFTGVKHLALYFNRMESNFINPEESIKIINNVIEKQKLSCGILAASFKNISQVMQAYTNGASSCTVPFAVLESSVNNILFLDGENKFLKDWDKAKLPTSWI